MMMSQAFWLSGAQRENGLTIEVEHQNMGRQEAETALTTATTTIAEGSPDL